MVDLAINHVFVYQLRHTCPRITVDYGDRFLAVLQRRLGVVSEY